MRRLFLLTLALLSCVLPVGATWSIIVVNRRTGEVAIGGATCLASTNLLKVIPAIAVGKGGGCIQAAGNTAALALLYDQLVAGEVPADVLQALKDADRNPNARQIGVVAFDGAPVTFTGGQAGRAKGGVAGEVGDLAYAIQGNVLTGAPVWLDAEFALLNTSGDLATRLRAAMEAARAAGGDGRCSCSLSDPDGCGSPPPTFDKSAHCGFMVIARIGDVDSVCRRGDDCATGAYYMKLNVKGLQARANSPDPVLQLHALYDVWRADLSGKADGVLSTVDAVEALPADGLTQRTITVALIDVDGVPLSIGGDDLQVRTLDGGPSLASLGPVTDHQNGSYSFQLTAGTTAGTDRFVLTARAGARRATLVPPLEVRQDPPAGLHVGYSQVSATDAPTVPLVVQQPGRAGDAYVLFASLGGTQPGTTVGNLHLPLNAPLLSILSCNAGAGWVLGTVGVLDANGRAEGALLTNPSSLLSVIGQRVDWASVVYGPGGPRLVSDAVGFDIVP